MDDKANKHPWMAGLFAGIFSSADGTWVPMSQLRRFSSVASWMLAFSMTSFGILRLAEGSEALDNIGILCLLGLYLFSLALAAASFCAFLWIGGWRFGSNEDKKDS